MLSHRCVYVCWSTSTYISTTIKMNSEPKKTSPGSSKKTAIHRKPQRYPAYPRNPQLQCCDRKCRVSSTEMAVFFEGHQTQNSEGNIEVGDGGHDLCGVVLHGMAVFFEESGLRKDTIGWTHGCRQTREWWRHCVRESIGISLGGCLCVGMSVCLRGRICANMGCAKWNACNDSLVLISFCLDSAMSLGALVFVLRGRCATLRAWLLYPVHLPCNTHATHMQLTCNIHATRHATWAFYL